MVFLTRIRPEPGGFYAWMGVFPLEIFMRGKEMVSKKNEPASDIDWNKRGMDER